MVTFSFHNNYMKLVYLSRRPLYKWHGHNLGRFKVVVLSVEYCELCKRSFSSFPTGKLAN